MANKDMPVGAKPVGRIYEYNIYQAEEAVYPGDFLNKNANGTVEPADATEPLVGVCMSYAATGGECLVADHPDQLFMIQSDSADVAAQADIGLNYNIVATAGNSTYKMSRMELDGNTGADTATLPLRLIRIDRATDNALGASVKCVVRINNHQNGSHTGTAGV